MLAKFSWDYHGTLNEINSTNGIGVYLLIYKGNPKRIIYVGTTNCFNRRMNQHKEGMLLGNRAIWRVDGNKDIYELMSYQGYSENGKYEYYVKLARNNLLWAATNLGKDNIVNDLYIKDDFTVNWEKYVTNEYIKNIEIWACDMRGSENRIVQLESQIQRAFKSNYKIGSHIHKRGMCWLGKIELLGNIFDYTFNFKICPDLEKQSVELLKNLTDKDVINYKKESYLEKKNTKIEELKEIRKKYKFSKTKWTLSESDILITLHKLGVSIEEISESYLYRTPEEIERRIKYLSKFYDFSKV